MKPLNFEPYVDKKIGESKEEVEFESAEPPRRGPGRRRRRWWRRWGWRPWGWRPLRRGPSTTCDLGSFLCCCLATTLVANVVTNGEE